MEEEDGVVGLLVVRRNADDALIRFQGICKLKLHSSIDDVVVYDVTVVAIVTRGHRL